MVFPGGKKKAFTVSYDDGVVQDKKLIEIMNRYGVKGTFNLNSGFLGKKEDAVIDGILTKVDKLKEEEVRGVYSMHEIACHALTHAMLSECTKREIHTQIEEDKKRLQAVCGETISGFAYPFGRYNAEIEMVLKQCGICYARTVHSTGGFSLPENFLEWHPTCHHNDAGLWHLLKKFCEENVKPEKVQVFYLWGHSYEFDQKQNWKLPEEIFSCLKQYERQIWFATNREIYEFIKNAI